MNESAREQPVKPLLTIAIPTYNRSSYLRELLSVLQQQVAKTCDVELIISDNASSDETLSVVESFQQLGVPIHYIRNDKNIGADGNFLQCFEKARGKYFWLFGDDDILLPGSLSLLMEKLASNTYDLVYVHSFALQTSSSLEESPSTLNTLDTCSAEVFVSNVHIYLTFISGNIVNKESALNGLEIPVSALQNSNLLQLGWTYAALNQFRRGIVVMDKLVGARVDNTGGYKLMEVFGPSLKAVTDSRVKDSRLRAIIMNGAVQRFWPGMLVNYKLNSESFSVEAKPDVVLGPVFNRNWRYWVFTLPIINLPIHLGRVWFFVIRIINRLDRACRYPLLRLR